MNLPALAAGAGVLVLLSPTGRRAVGVPVVPFVTSSQVAAMAPLASPILGSVTADPAARSQAFRRYLEVMRYLHGSRGFVVVGAVSLPRLSAKDGQTILFRFIEAARAGVDAGGYRVTNLGLVGGLDVNAATMGKIEDGTGVESVPLTSLGSAVLAAARERNRLSYVPNAIPMSDADLVAFNKLMARLSAEMDGAGYLESGKPPPDQTVLGGIAAAGDAVGRFTAGIAGNAAGGVASALVGSSLFWFAGLAFLAFKVLR